MKGSTTAKTTKLLRIAIFSLTDDLHALTIQHTLKELVGIECHVVETDNLVHNGGLSWGSVSSQPPLILSRDSDWFDVRELDLIWWRRVSYPQRDHPSFSDEYVRQLVSNEWKTALYGLLTGEFTGCWISNPEKTLRAQNKLLQIQAAQTAGLRVPRTLVSQDPEAVRCFCAMQENEQVIVKALRGAMGRILAAVPITLRQLEDAAIRLCPAIYQELIPGRQHLRINCFGDDIYPFLIETDALDWRRNLQAPMSPYSLDEQTQEQLLEVLRILGLEMGIIDAKLTPDGELVWLEVNPQGQFLFAEGMTGSDLTTPFARFLEAKASTAKKLGTADPGIVQK